MENDINHYLSLTEATKFCSYSQEYLSLRARQGKLKAIKFGRNWVTKKEWLEEYLKEIGSTEYEVEKEIRPQRKLSRVNFDFLKIFAPQKALLAWGLVFVLLVGGVAFGKDSFKYVFETVGPYITKFNENIDDFFVSSAQNFFNVGKDANSFVKVFNANFDKGVAIEIQNLKLKIENFRFPQGFGRQVKFKIENSAKNFSFYTHIIVGDLADLFFDVSQNFVNFSVFKNKISLAVEKFLKSYPVLAEIGKKPTKTFKEYFGWLGKTIIEKSFALKNFFAQKLSWLGEKIIGGLKKIPEVVTRPFRPKVIVVEKLPPETEKKITEMEEKLKELAEKPAKEVEVSKITKIEQLKEIKVVDEKSLAELKSQIARIQTWQEDIRNLQLDVLGLKTYQPPVISVAGSGAFTSLGVSGLAGIQFLGVGSSASLGTTPLDKLTVNATADFLTPANFKQGLNVGTAGNLTVDSNGNLLTTGTIQMAGFKMTTGAYNGYVLTSNDLGVGTWQLPSGGGADTDWIIFSSTMYATTAVSYVGIATTSPQYALHVWGSAGFGTSTTPTLYVDSGNGRVGIGTTTPSYKFHLVDGASSIYLSGGITPTIGTTYGSGSTIELYNWNTGNMTLTTNYSSGNIILQPGASGNVGIGTSTPATLFTVATTTANILNVTASGNVGIGTASPNVKLRVMGTMNATRVEADGSIYLGWNGDVSGYSLGTASGYDLNLVSPTNKNIILMPSGISGVGYVGIATTSPQYKLHVWGSAGFGTSTTPVLYVDSGTGNVGIGTTGPTEKLAVVSGNILQIPGTPVAVGGVDLADNAGRGVYVSGRYAYVVKEFNTGTCSGTTLTGCEFSIYDVSNPASPAPVGGVNLANNPGYDIYVSGRYAYLVKDGNGGTCSGTTLTGCEFSIYDISNPSAPAPVGGADFGTTYGNGVYVSGRYAYVVKTFNTGTCSGTTLDGCEFSIYDISNPASPAPVGGVDFATTTGGNDVYVSGPYAYVVKDGNGGTCSGSTVTGCEFIIYDVSNPASPTPVGGADLADTTGNSVYVSGRYAYVVKDNNTGTCSGTTLTGCEFSIYDVSNPSSPAPVGGANLAGGYGYKISVSGRYAYVIKGYNAGTCSGTTLDGCEFSIYDISNPSAPAPVGGADLTDSGSTGRSLYVSGHYAYVTKSSNTGTCSGTTLTGCEFSIYDVLGIEVSSGIVHSLEAGNLQVRNDIMTQGQLQVTGGINIGKGGLSSQGEMGIYASSSVTALTVSQSGTGYGAIITAGNVGIATTTPQYKLHVWGSAGFGTSTTPTLYVDSGNGRVGIGTASPSASLSLVGTSTNSKLLTLKTTSDTAEKVVWTADGTIEWRGLTTGGGGRRTQLYEGSNTQMAGLTVWSVDLDTFFAVADSNEAYLTVGKGRPMDSSYSNILLSRSFASKINMITTAKKGTEALYDLVFGIYDSDNFTEVFRISTTTASLGIGTTTPAALLDIWASSTATALSVTQTQNGNIVDFKSGATSVFTLASADRLKLRDGLLISWGEFNDNVIADFESGSVSNWISSDATNTKASATTTQIKVNDYSMAITTVVANSNNDTVTTSISNANWSSYERLAFWIRADYTSTSTDATDTQLIMVLFHDIGGTTTVATTTIQEMGLWQYQEWDISGIGSTERDSVDWFGFKIINDYGSPTFYLDQIRLYDYPERASEVFVDSNGNLNFVSPSKIELTRASANEGSLASVSIEPAVVQINQPLAVNVGGDVGMSYDLAFLNTGLSSITSEGPLQIVAGDPNHYENLTLTTAGIGDVIIDIRNSTIGFKVISWPSGGYIMRISPAGNFEISQNILTLGGSITLQQLATPASTTYSTSTGGSCSNTTYYYRITAANDNGESLPSATSSASGSPGSIIINLSWVPVEGATKYYFYRSTNPAFGPGSTASSTMVSAATSTYADDCAGDSNRTVPSTNTSGGKLTTTGDILPATTSIYNLGSTTTKWANLYAVTTTIGDIIFANQFRISEAISTSSPQALILFNASSTQILAIDENGLLTVNKLVAKEIETEKITIKNAEVSQTGITIFDRATGEPYCVFVENGQIQTNAGECSTSTAATAASTTGSELINGTDNQTSSNEFGEAGPSPTSTTTETATTTPPESTSTSTEPTVEQPLTEQIPTEPVTTTEPTNNQ